MGCQYLAFYISENSRRNLAIVLIFFQVAGMAIGLIVMITGIYFKQETSVNNILLSGYIFESFPNCLIYNGIILIILHIIGFQICIGVLDWKILYRNRIRYKFMGRGFVLIMFIYLLVLGGLAIVAQFYDKQLYEGYTEGFKEAMSLYFINPLKKSQVDKIQFKWRCCGTIHYRDWFTIHWIKAEDVFYDPRSYEAMKTMSAGRVLKFQTPFSCCDPQITRPCIFENIVNSSMHVNYRFDADLTVFKQGCSEVLINTFGAFWVWILKKGIAYGMLFEAISLIIFRYMQSSMDVALKFDDPTLTAQGYICGCGLTLIPPGYDPDDKWNRMYLLDELSRTTDEVMDYKQYDLSEEDKKSMVQREKLISFLDEPFNSSNKGRVKK